MTRLVLIVDDDPHIRQVLAFALAKAGYATIEAAEGEAALVAVAGQQPDLVILDINMPRLDGLEVCRRLRAAGDLPILFLSSRDDEIDRIVGIELGADDYVVKPFSPREVVARAGAILKRSRRPPAAPPPAEKMQRGSLQLDLPAWSAAVAGRDLGLTRTEFQLLAVLAAVPGKVFSRDEMIDRLHGPGFAVTDRTIDSHIRHIRRKCAEAGLPDAIETRAGIGYRLGPCRGDAPP